jgi:hypothetical protein
VKVVKLTQPHKATANLAITSFGIPLTSSISAGFTIGFMKG